MVALTDAAAAAIDDDDAPLIGLPVTGRETMRWAVFKEVVIQRLYARNGEASVHSAQVSRVLDRFTRYRSLASADVSQVTNRDLDEYVVRRRSDTWRGKPLAVRTINNEIDILNAALAVAGPIERKGPGRRNLALVEMPPCFDRIDGDDPEPMFCGDDQIARFVSAAEYATTPMVKGCSPATFWKCALILDWLTLLRRSALLMVPRPVDYVLLELKQLRLPASLNKTRRNVTISLGSRPELIDLFAAMPSQPGEPLLPWKSRAGKPLSPAHFTNTMASIQRAAGISDTDRLRLKYLRSTASTLVGDESGTAVAKRKLKHSPTTTTFEKHYQVRHVPPEEVAATDSLADRMMAILSRPADQHAAALRLAH